jgi:outer membrane protein assembly factor BamB
MNNMKTSLHWFTLITLLAAGGAAAQDWPQWRGANRDAKAAGFNAPKEWPKELTRKWRIDVGDGVATPSLVGDKLYVFARQEGGEIIRCLNVATGEELWRNKYDALGASGPAASFAGPRCSPTIAEGKVVTLGVRGMLSCLDATTGALLWRKDDFKGATPRFQTSASPVVAAGLCVAQLGDGETGAIVAYDLKSGEEKWRWAAAGEGPAYASPVLLTVGGTQYVIAETTRKIVALALTDGTLAWETPFAVPGRGYNATTPVIEGQTLIYTGSGRGATAVKLEKDGDKLVAKELWKNPDNSVQFTSPVVKDGLVFAISARDEFFCLNMKDGTTAWVAPSTKEASTGEAAGNTDRAPAVATNPPTTTAAMTNTNAPPSGSEGNRPREGRGGGGRGRLSGYGSIVDAGPVLLALTPASQLVVFEPNAIEFKELARIKVADTPTFAYPIASANRLIIKDQNSVTLWTVP